MYIPVKWTAASWPVAPKKASSSNSWILINFNPIDIGERPGIGLRWLSFISNLEVGSFDFLDGIPSQRTEFYDQ